MRRNVEREMMKTNNREELEGSGGRVQAEFKTRKERKQGITQIVACGSECRVLKIEKNAAFFTDRLAQFAPFSSHCTSPHVTCRYTTTPGGSLTSFLPHATRLVDHLLLLFLCIYFFRPCTLIISVCNRVLASFLFFL